MYLYFFIQSQEFKDTLNYVANIRPKAERYGICRVVPPPSWKPPELLKGKKKWGIVKFSTYVQEVDELKDRCSKRKLHEITANVKGKRRTAPRMGMEYGPVGGCNADSDEVEYSHEGFEFECGPNFTLDTFKKYADHFKEHYFCKKHEAVNVDANLSVLPVEHTLEVKDIEGEYWRIIENPTAKIEVCKKAQCNDFWILYDCNRLYIHMYVCVNEMYFCTDALFKLVYFARCFVVLIWIVEHSAVGFRCHPIPSRHKTIVNIWNQAGI